MSLSQFLELPETEQEIYHAYEEKRRVKILRILSSLVEHKSVTPEALTMIQLELLR